MARIITHLTGPHATFSLAAFLGQETYINQQIKKNNNNKGENLIIHQLNTRRKEIQKKTYKTFRHHT